MPCLLLVVAAAVAAAAAAPPPFVTVDTTQALGPALNPLIYGANGVDPTPATPYPLYRWGGNAATRYNFQYDMSNRASDWFFLNEPGPGGSDAKWLDSVAGE
jgi:hypothetical protein